MVKWHIGQSWRFPPHSHPKVATEAKVATIMFGARSGKIYLQWPNGDFTYELPAVLEKAEPIN